MRIASAFNSKARRLGIPGTVSAIELAAKPRKCAYCGILVDKGAFDHIIPLAEGGLNISTNIVRCCLDCNRRKFLKTPAEFDEHRQLIVSCLVCGRQYQPRWAEYRAGRAKVCSRSCAGKKRWMEE